MAIIDLSHTIKDGMAGYPGDAPPRLTHQLIHGRDGLQSSILDMSCHTGTHIDSPLHFLAGQPALDAIPPDFFSGHALVLATPTSEPPGPLAADLPAGGDLTEIDFLILRTGWERWWGTDRYYATWPYLSVDLARRIATLGLKGVGLDSPSVDSLGSREVHDLFAAAGLVNVENLANLAALPRGPFLFLALPLKLAATEASPVRAVALV